MKKNYLIIGAGLLLVYWYLKNQKAKQPENVQATDGVDSITSMAVQNEEIPLLVSPSQQQTINEFKPGKNDNGKGITVRYVAGTHYI